jgi:UDP-N-acetylmuramoyl-L-alanyl-D-glutamate--2,6-diaminopimelate ligase
VPADIRAQVLAGARPVAAERGSRLIEIGDRRAAIRQAVQVAGTGDAVVIAGKGHELGQDVGGVIHPFSDRAELAGALRSVTTARAAGPPAVPSVSDDPTSLLGVTDPDPKDHAAS